MSNELSLFSPSGALSRRDSRNVGRELSRLEASERLGLARIDQATTLAAARAERLAHVAGAAMDAVARVSLRAEQYSQVVPAAAGRIHAIADALTIAEIGLVHDAARRLG